MSYNKSKRFVLKSANLYVGNLNPKTMTNDLVPTVEKAMVLDWQDNEQMKAKFFSAIYGVEFHAEELA